MLSAPLRGLVAATFTPLHADGSLQPELIPGMVNFLIDRGVSGLYVLGSTGEGPSLTVAERCLLAEHFLAAAKGRVPVIVQVGCESLWQARELAGHAQQAGAAGISAVSPVYFKPESAAGLVASMGQIAAGAPQLPFYYYHIPAVTGVAVSALEFLRLASREIPNLRGIKFTSPAMHDFQSCVEFAEGRFDMLWGLDEMLASGLAAGAQGAVGSTYNFAAPIYLRLLEAWQRGDLPAVRAEQSRSQALVRAFVPYGARAAQKAIMSMVWQNCGPTRLPVSPLTPEQSAALQQDLRQIGFFDWIGCQ